jgi:hypothetical protein
MTSQTYNILFSEELVQKADIVKILKENISEESLKSTYLAGGAAIAFVGDHLSSFGDYDFFFETQSAFDEFFEYLSNFGRQSFTSENAISFNFEGEQVQIVSCSFKPIEDILNDFDLRNCMVAIPMSDSNSILDLRKGALKTLVLNNLERSSLPRILKYIKYGYTASEKLIFKIVDGHKSGTIKQLYDNKDIKSEDEIRRYFSAVVDQKNEMLIKVLFESFPEGGWLKDALFATNRNFARVLTKENNKYTVSRLQELAIIVNSGLYDSVKEEIRENYPEYFIAGEKLYSSIDEIQKLWPGGFI